MSFIVIINPTMILAFTRLLMLLSMAVVVQAASTSMVVVVVGAMVALDHLATIQSPPRHALPMHHKVDLVVKSTYGWDTRPISAGTYLLKITCCSRNLQLLPLHSMVHIPIDAPTPALLTILPIN
jgi:hypothetical protein